MTRDQDRPGRNAPGLDEIAAMAGRALTEIPSPLREHLNGIEIRVEEFPTAEMIRSLELDSPFELLGLYEGISLPDKSSFDALPPPDRIFLFRRPILDYWCETGEELGHLVRHVLIHEAGHHFGFSDADMEALEAEADAGAA